MPYIYRYTDKNGEVRYVGIVKKDTNFPYRFYQHKSDEWFKESDEWTVEYSYYSSQNDVEMLEAHLISSYLKRGDRLFNKAKREWGVSSFVKEEDIEWKTFKEPLVHKKGDGWRKTKTKAGLTQWIEVGACWQLTRMLMRLSIEKINHTPGLQSAKNYSYAVTVYKKMNAFEAKLNMESKMLNEVDPEWNDYPYNQLLSVFTNGFLRDNPVSELVSDKAVELLCGVMAEVSNYKAKREIEVDTTVLPQLHDNKQKGDVLREVNYL